MKKSLLFIFVLISLSSVAQSNWINGHAVWHYEYFDPTFGNGGYSANIKMETLGDTIIQGHTCQKLKSVRAQYMDLGHDNIVIVYPTTYYNYIYFEQDTVWCLKGNQFSVLYDFTASEGQTRFLGIGTENQECSDSSYLFVDSVYSGDLSGVNTTFYQLRDSSSNSILHGGLVNSHFGMMSSDFDFSHSFFPVEAWCSEGLNKAAWYRLICFEDDSLTYVNVNPDCLDDECCYYYYQFLELEENQLNNIHISPNPASDYVTLTSDEVISEVTFYNVLGETCLKSELNAVSAEIDLSDLKNGIYLAAIQTKAGKELIRRINVQK